jgi:hypothetical protein
MEGEGRSRLGEPARTVSFVVVPLAGAPRGAKVWLEEDAVLAVQIELPPLADLPALLSELGPPAAKLDWTWDVVAVPGGEWVWPDRGLTLALDRSGAKVVKAWFYPPTTAADWSARLRPAGKVREEP